MLKIALTGGIACGKSMVGEFMADLGASVLDSDDLAHQLMEPGQQVYKDVLDRFGNDILGVDKRIDRALLAMRVFDNAEKLESLNKTVHPGVKRMWQEWLSAVKTEVAIVIIPLLYEIDEANGWDAVICVSSSEVKQLARMRERGLSECDARKRICSQMPVSLKSEMADFVITNNGSIENLNKQINKIWSKVTEI